MTTRFYWVMVALTCALLASPGGAQARSGGRDGQAPPKSKYDDEDSGPALRGYRPRPSQHGVPGMKVYKPGYTSERGSRHLEGSKASDHRPESPEDADELEE